MPALGEVILDVIPNAAGFGTKLRAEMAPAMASAEAQAATGAKGIGARFAAMGTAAKAGLAVAGFAAAKLVTDSVSAFADAQAIQAQTTAVLKSTGEAAGVSAGDVAELAKQTSELSGIDDDAVQASENLLLTFKDVRDEAGAGNDIFSQTTQAIADMATAMNQGAIPSQELLKQTTIQVGKAMNDPIRGMTALRRVGVTFNDTQVETIKRLQESGDLMSAQKIVLGELQTEFGGAAKAAGDTFAGQLAKLHTQFKNVEESIGSVLVPLLQGLLKLLQPLLDLFLALPAPVKTAAVAVGIFALAVKVLGGNVGDTFRALFRFIRNIPTGIPTLGALAVGITSVVIGLQEMSAASRAAEQAQRDVQKELTKTGGAVDTYAGALHRLQDEQAKTDPLGALGQGLIQAETGRKTSLEILSDSLNDIVTATNAHKQELAVSLGGLLGLSQDTAQGVGRFFRETTDHITPVRGELTGLTAALAGATGASDDQKAAFAGLVGRYQEVTGSLGGLNLAQLQSLVAEGKLGAATDDVEAAFGRFYGTVSQVPGAVGDVGRALEGASRTLDTFNEFFGTTLDLSKGTKAALAEAREAYDQWAVDVADSLNFVKSDFADLATKQGQTVEGLQAGLDKDLANMQRFSQDLRTIAKDGGRGARELVQQLLAVGPAALGMADKLVASGKEGRAGIERDLGQAFRQSKTEAQQLERALVGGFHEIARAIIIATTPVDQLQEKLAALEGSYAVHINVLTHYEQIGKPPVGTPAQIHSGQILGATASGAPAPAPVGATAALGAGPMAAPAGGPSGTAGRYDPRAMRLRHLQTLSLRPSGPVSMVITNWQRGTGYLQGKAREDTLALMQYRDLHR